MPLRMEFCSFPNKGSPLRQHYRALLPYNPSPSGGNLCATSYNQGWGQCPSPEVTLLLKSGCRGWWWCWFSGLASLALCLYPVGELGQDNCAVFLAYHTWGTASTTWAGQWEKLGDIPPRGPLYPRLGAEGRGHPPDCALWGRAPE